MIVRPIATTASSRGQSSDADISSMPDKVFEQMFKHSLTDRGLKTFPKDREKARESLGEITEFPAPKIGR